MRVEPLGVEGAWRIEWEPNHDERGWFARTYDRDALAAHGIDLAVSQSSVSFNAQRHTLRGLHLQRSPKEETKLLRCTRGAIYDVVLDLRPASPTFCRWDAVTLTSDDFVSLVLPPGTAHGFLTLEDESAVTYDISIAYDPSLAAGVRWDDPAFAIEWPATPAVISERDLGFADFRR